VGKFKKKILDPHRDPHQPPKSNRLLLIAHLTPRKMSTKFVDNFLSYPADRQTDRGKNITLAEVI